MGTAEIWTLSGAAMAHWGMLGVVLTAIILSWLGEHGDDRMAAIVGGVLAIIVISTVMVGIYDPTVQVVGCL